MRILVLGGTVFLSRAALDAPAGAHWVYVSSVSVYADAANAAAGGPVAKPVVEDVDLRAHPEAYGGMEVACEDLVSAGALGVTILRAGLIGGPGDPTGRFTYWPVRLACLVRRAPGRRTDRPGGGPGGRAPGQGPGNGGTFRRYRIAHSGDVRTEEREGPV